MTSKMLDDKTRTARLVFLFAGSGFVLFQLAEVWKNELSPDLIPFAAVGLSGLLASCVALANKPHTTAGFIGELIGMGTIIVVAGVLLLTQLHQ